MHALTSAIPGVSWPAISNGEKRFLQSVSPAMEQVLRVVESLAQSDVPVLIVGEPGTGKLALAEEIHRLSRKHSGAFVTMQGANPQWNDEAGDEIAWRRGTVYVHGVDALDAAQQAKILQLFFESNSSQRSSTARLIVSSERNLEPEVRRKRFREELYYRISSVCLCVPPLRQRKEDIAGLAQYFAARYSALLGRPAELSPRLLQVLCEHAWPGNIRELENVVRTVIAIGDEKIAQAAIRASGWQVLSQEKNGVVSLKQAARAASQAAERELILNTLHRTRWNRKRAARELQISYKALLYKLKQSGIGQDDTGILGAPE
jgi:two-component system response regulator AtoC